MSYTSVPQNSPLPPDDLPQNNNQQELETPLRIRDLVPVSTRLSLGLAWGVVFLFWMEGTTWLALPLSPLVGMLCFSVLFATIIVAAFSVVKEADFLAHKLGEPYGTLILTLSVVLIEVILISSVMLGSGEFPTIGRDAVFSVMMIILNLVMGLCLLLGGFKYHEQDYNAQGAQTYISMIGLLTGFAFVLPNFLPSGNGIFSTFQAIAISGITIIGYGVFLALQMGAYRRLFIQPASGVMAIAPSEEVVKIQNPFSASEYRAILVRSTVLIAAMIPIVLLSHDLAVVIDYGIDTFRAPKALGGVLIAIIVFTPESLTAIRASLANETQRVLNLCLGAFLSTVGLTVPAVLIIGVATGKTVLMGLSSADTILFLLTLFVTLMSFAGQRTAPIQGMLHLMLFVVFGVVLFAS